MVRRPIVKRRGSTSRITSNNPAAKRGRQKSIPYLGSLRDPHLKKNVVATRLTQITKAHDTPTDRPTDRPTDPTDRPTEPDRPTDQPTCSSI